MTEEEIKKLQQSIEEREKKLEDKEKKLIDKDNLLQGLNVLGISKLEDLKSYVGPKGSEEPEPEPEPKETDEDLKERVARIEQQEKQKIWAERQNKIRNYIKKEIKKENHPYLDTLKGDINVLDAIAEEMFLIKQKTGHTPKLGAILEEKEKLITDKFSQQAEALGYKKGVAEDEKKEEEKAEEKKTEEKPADNSFQKLTDKEVLKLSSQKQAEYFFDLATAEEKGVKVIEPGQKVEEKPEEKTEEKTKEKPEEPKEEDKSKATLDGDNKTETKQEEREMSKSDKRKQEMKDAGFDV